MFGRYDKDCGGCSHARSALADGSTEAIAALTLEFENELADRER